MAIVVEEENNNKTGVVRIVTWVTVIILISAAAYYIFFAQPELVGLVSPPSNFTNIDSLSQISLNPEEVINSSGFQSLKQYITLPVAGNAGRQNPFLQF